MARGYSASAAGNVQVVDATQAALVATVNGIQLTLTAISRSATPTLGANDQGFGVSTNGESCASETRIDLPACPRCPAALGP